MISIYDVIVAQKSYNGEWKSHSLGRDYNFTHSLCAKLLLGENYDVSKKESSNFYLLCENWHVFNGKCKRRTMPINMSVRDKGLSVIAVWALKRTKSRRGCGWQLVRPLIIYSIVQKMHKENWEQVNGDYWSQDSKTLTLPLWDLFPSVEMCSCVRVILQIK